MAKYLLQASYSHDGVKGVLEEGGTKRMEAVRAAVEALGGTLESFYFAFGDVDCYCIVDLPSNVTAMTASLVGNAAGTNQTKFTVLATPEEVDQAAEAGRAAVSVYRAPGQ